MESNLRLVVIDKKNGTTSFVKNSMVSGEVNPAKVNYSDLWKS